MHGLARDPSGNIWVADTAQGDLKVYSPSGTLLATHSWCPTPMSIAFGPGNTIYVSTQSGVIYKFDSSGNQLAQSATYNYGTQIAADQAGNVYATPGLSTFVRKYDSGLAQIAQWTGYVQAFGVGVDSAGNPWFGDMGHYLVKKVDPLTGVVQVSWSAPSAGHIAFDSTGNVWVTQASNGGSIRKYDQSGNLLAQIPGPGPTSPPSALALDAADDVYISDYITVKKYKFFNTTVHTPEPVVLAAGVSLSYDTVTAAGNTAASTISPSGPPTGYSFLSGYDVTTDATYDTSGGKYIYVTLPYSYSGSAASLKLFHQEGGVWVDRTYSVDTSAQTITARVTSLSPFAIGAPSGSGPVTSTPASSDWSILLGAVVAALVAGLALRRRRARLN